MLKNSNRSELCMYYIELKLYNIKNNSKTFHVKR